MYGSKSYWLVQKEEVKGKEYHCWAKVPLELAQVTTTEMILGDGGFSLTEAFTKFNCLD